jgi:CheY-like chemotaxis protein/HPt (histidine-containing phosphotransfer) domain-containing protein
VDGGVAQDGVVPVQLTAVMVDDEPEGRWRVTDLLTLGGWEVFQASGAENAVRRTADLDPDLVVVDISPGRTQAAALFRRLRRTGSRARFLIVAAGASDELRAESATAGALACLPKPVDPRLLLSFLRSRTTGPTAQDPLADIHDIDIELADIHDVDDLHDADIDADLGARLQDIYVTSLPSRLSAITAGARSGDPVAVASAAFTLAGTSGQLGHSEVAAVCQEIARDARRGVLAHSRLVELQTLARA